MMGCVCKDGLVYQTMTSKYLNEQPQQMVQNGNDFFFNCACLFVCTYYLMWMSIRAVICILGTEGKTIHI